MRNIQASATIFGFQFQINSAIYLMIKNFSSFEKLKVEGEQEDIEIYLTGNQKIYAQAKSKEFPTKDNIGHSEKLAEALRTLSNVKDFNCKELIYINNLEDNPLNSGTDEFKGVTFLKYNELKGKSKEKIDYQINKHQYEIDKDKLIIAKIPFYGDDSEQRHKEINDKMENFISEISPSIKSFSKKIISMWEEEFLQNASTKCPKLTINKENVTWGLIICKLQLDDVKKFDDKLDIDETDFLDAIDEYDKIIDMKSYNFLDYNKIIQIYKSYKLKNPSSTIYDFILGEEEQIFNMIFPEKEKNNVLNACSRIIAKEIIMRSKNIEEIKEGVENYGD